MRMYAMQHYSLQSTNFLEHCRQREKDKKKALAKRRLKKKPKKGKPPTESIFEARLIAKLKGTDLEIRPANEPPKRTKRQIVPKLAWANGTESEFFVNKCTSSDEEEPGTETKLDSTAMKFELKPPSRPQTARSHRPNTSRSYHSKGGFFQTAIDTSRPNTSRTRGSRWRSEFGTSRSGRSTFRSTTNRNNKFKITKAAIRLQKQRALSPKSRSKVAFNLSKFTPKPFDVNPSLDDWES